MSIGEQTPAQVRADEAGPPGNEQSHPSQSSCSQRPTAPPRCIPTTRVPRLRATCGTAGILLAGRATSASILPHARSASAPSIRDILSRRWRCYQLCGAGRGREQAPRRVQQAQRVAFGGVMPTKRILITGGAGFIGSNAARYFGARNWTVTVLDNLSRAGTEKNLVWLRDGTTFDFEQVDVRDQPAIDRILSQSRFDAVLHLAAQVAVTTSVADPRTDFAVNALGTFNMLDAVRMHCPEAVFIFASTNKVYGKVAAAGDGTARQPLRLQSTGRTASARPSRWISFRPTAARRAPPTSTRSTSPGSTASPRPSFRQSCIYGPRQFGVEDQGWVAWFVIAAILGRDVTIFGDGKQVRDVLHVDDLLARLRGGDPRSRQGGAAGLQRRRRAGPRPVPARPDRDAGGAPRPQDDPALGRLAPRR